MSNADHNHEADDSKVDAIAAVVLFTIVIGTVIFWLSSM